MRLRFAVLSPLAVCLALASLVGTAFAQDAPDTLPAHPRFARLLPHINRDEAIKAPSVVLKTWNNSFTYGSHVYNYNMVGTKPATGTSTTIPVFIIPVALKYTTGTTTKTFTPTTKQTNGLTAIANTVASPIFQNMDWMAGDGVTDLGTTQYEDAFQRGNFWHQVSTHPGYHVLLGTPKVLQTRTLTVPSTQGRVGNEFGVTVGLADLNWFDNQIQTVMNGIKDILPNTLPIFITYDVYLTDQGSCCVGGYHSSYGSASGTQSYSMFTYISKPGAFSQDVAALSHEIGEWIDDPLVVNNGTQVACGYLEVGDPEESFPNYGDFPYTLNGFTYHLQDLVYLEYFGASSTLSVGGEMTFQNNPFGLTVCSNGG